MIALVRGARLSIVLLLMTIGGACGSSGSPGPNTKGSGGGNGSGSGGNGNSNGTGGAMNGTGGASGTGGMTGTGGVMDLSCPTSAPAGGAPCTAQMAMTNPQCLFPPTGMPMMSCVCQPTTANGGVYTWMCVDFGGS